MKIRQSIRLAVLVCSCFLFTTGYGQTAFADENHTENNYTAEAFAAEDDAEVTAAGKLESFIKNTNDTVLQTVDEVSQAADQFVEQQSETQLRNQVVDYALSFVGGRYKYGGTDPHTGVDCSGFVRYVLQNSAGVSMSRTSRTQAQEGVSISADQMQPGDLLFYGNSRNINHVAMYIGDGRIVHASTERTGIKTSIWNYRNPVKIVSVLG